jgi:hypothetical protein
MYRVGPRTHIPFPPSLILYVNFVTKGAPKIFKALAPRLTVLDILTLVMHIVTLCVLQTYTTLKANTQNPVSHDPALA